jgi:hypothetical protein
MAETTAELEALVSRPAKRHGSRILKLYQNAFV